MLETGAEQSAFGASLRSATHRVVVDVSSPKTLLPSPILHKKPALISRTRSICVLRPDQKSQDLNRIRTRISLPGGALVDVFSGFSRLFYFVSRYGILSQFVNSLQVTIKTNLLAELKHQAPN